VSTTRSASYRPMSRSSLPAPIICAAAMVAACSGRGRETRRRERPVRPSAHCGSTSLRYLRRCSGAWNLTS
jgi:hypothetical protein